MKNLLKIILQSLILTGLVLGFFYLLGIVEMFIEKHFWLIIPLGITALIKLFKEI